MRMKKWLAYLNAHNNASMMLVTQKTSGWVWRISSRISQRVGFRSLSSVWYVLKYCWCWQGLYFAWPCPKYMFQNIGHQFHHGALARWQAIQLQWLDACWICYIFIWGMLFRYRNWRWWIVWNMSAIRQRRKVVWTNVVADKFREARSMK